MVLIGILIPSAFIVACLVSFRSLWTGKRKDNRKYRANLERQRAMILAQERKWGTGYSTLRRKWGSLLDTLADLEDTTLPRNAPRHIHLTVPSGRMTVDFSQFGVAQESTSEAKTSKTSHSTHVSSVNAQGGHDNPVQSAWMREPQALDSEFNLLRHAEPLPSYQRPGTAV